MAIAEEGLRHGGDEEISLLSLSTADHSEVEQLVERVSVLAAEHGVAVALPSLRADAFPLVEAALAGPAHGLHVRAGSGERAPAPGHQQGISEEDILAAIERALAAGWSGVKLYLMIGHPTEGDADFEELAGLVEKIRRSCACGPGTA